MMRYPVPREPAAPPAPRYTTSRFIQPPAVAVAQSVFLSVLAGLRQPDYAPLRRSHFVSVLVPDVTGTLFVWMPHGEVYSAPARERTSRFINILVPDVAPSPGGVFLSALRGETHSIDYPPTLRVSRIFRPLVPDTLPASLNVLFQRPLRGVPQLVPVVRRSTIFPLLVPDPPVTALNVLFQHARRGVLQDVSAVRRPLFVTVLVPDVVVVIPPPIPPPPVPEPVIVVVQTVGPIPGETDFLNGALGKAGCGRITNIEDGTVNANWCKVYYASLRRGALALANWKFASTRLQLNLNAVPPLFGFNAAYALPVEMIKLRQYNGVAVNLIVAQDWNQWRYYGGNWRVEGKFLYSNDASAFIEYVADVTNPNLWSTLFYKMLESWLASDLAIAIRHDHSASKALLEEAMGVWMPAALAVDGQAAAVEQYIVDDLTWGRS